MQQGQSVVTERQLVNWLRRVSCILGGLCETSYLKVVTLIDGVGCVGRGMGSVRFLPFGKPNLATVLCCEIF